MAIGNDDLDLIDDYEPMIDDANDLIQDNENDYIDSRQEEITEDREVLVESDFIEELLKTKGIEDINKIKFENEDGEIEEVSWSSLSNKDRLNIINSSSDNSNELQDQEIYLINAIRESKLSPAEYIQAIQRQGIDEYRRNTVDESYSYKVDDLTDEELYVADLITKIPDITKEEAFEALDRIKQNETLFKRQMGAIRSEYIKAEKETIQQEQWEQQQRAQEQYNQFAEGIENSILNFTEFSGCDLNMDQRDMQELYEFITGVDAAGVNHFGKVLNNPDALVRLAWFALNGEQMINDINTYYKNEISKVREASYNKGLQEGRDKPHVVHKSIKPDNTQSYYYDDLD